MSTQEGSVATGAAGGDRGVPASPLATVSLIEASPRTAAGLCVEALVSERVAWCSQMWSALFLTLPRQPNAVRLRTWRALRALGCGALRDGVYLLPEHQLALFEAVPSGLREIHADDDALTLAAGAVFDALYAASGTPA